MKKLFSTFVLTLVVAGCSSSSSDPNAGPGAEDSGAAGATAADAALETQSEAEASACASTTGDACNDCMASSCCEAYADCNADPDCVACVTAADGTACEKTPETHARVNEFLVCKGGACSGQCISDDAGTCANVANGFLPPNCVHCLEAACCSEVAACHANDGCWVDCLTEHDEAKCHGNADGHALFHAFSQCASQGCQAECF
jgi:hypothetical protein